MAKTILKVFLFIFAEIALCIGSYLFFENYFGTENTAYIIMTVLVGALPIIGVYLYNSNWGD